MTSSSRPDSSYADSIKNISLNQEIEYERLRIQHALHKAAMSDTLIRVPLSTTSPLQILDSATGDGTWMLDIHQQYPLATVTGTDIFPKHFSQYSNISPQISFKVQSVLDDWPASDHERYNLVHQRYCLAQFSPTQDASIIKRLFGLVRPGGYIQLVDANLGAFDRGKGHEGLSIAMNYFLRAFAEAGMESAPGPKMANWLREVGALDVKEEVLGFPVGMAAKTTEEQRSTTALLLNIVDNFAEIGLKRPDYWYSPEDFVNLKREMLKELATVGNTWRFWVVTGKIPE